MPIIVSGSSIKELQKGTFKVSVNQIANLGFKMTRYKVIKRKLLCIPVEISKANLDKTHYWMQSH